MHTLCSQGYEPSTSESSPKKPLKHHKTFLASTNLVAGGFLMVASNSWRLLGTCCYFLKAPPFSLCSHSSTWNTTKMG